MAITTKFASTDRSSSSALVNTPLSSRLFTLRTPITLLSESSGTDSSDFVE